MDADPSQEQLSWEMIFLPRLPSKRRRKKRVYRCRCCCLCYGFDMVRFMTGGKLSLRAI